MGNSQESALRILVVDDDETIRMLLSRFFEMQNYVAETAADGETALQLVRSQPFDVIFVDFQMPGITGLEFTTQVRQQYPNLPIALITGVAHRLTDADLEQAGVTKLFTKPFDLDDLSEWLESLS